MVLAFLVARFCVLKLLLTLVNDVLVVLPHILIFVVVLVVIGIVALTIAGFGLSIFVVLWVLLSHALFHYIMPHHLFFREAHSLLPRVVSGLLPFILMGVKLAFCVELLQVV